MHCITSEPDAPIMFWELKNQKKLPSGYEPKFFSLVKSTHNHLSHLESFSIENDLRRQLSCFWPRSWRRGAFLFLPECWKKLFCKDWQMCERKCRYSSRLETDKLFVGGVFLFHFLPPLPLLPAPRTWSSSPDQTSHLKKPCFASTCTAKQPLLRGRNSKKAHSPAGFEPSIAWLR